MQNGALGDVSKVPKQVYTALEELSKALIPHNRKSLHELQGGSGLALVSLLFFVITSPTLVLDLVLTFGATWNYHPPQQSPVLCTWQWDVLQRVDTKETL